MKKNNKFPWKIISTRKIYKNTWLSVREDKVIHPSGKKGIYSVVEISPAVGIVPMTDSGDLILLDHWRYPARKKSIEIPLGGVEKGESFLAAAKRELLEETGYQAKKWKYLSSFESSNCMTTDKAELFLASGLYLPENQKGRVDIDEAAQVIKLSLQKAVNMVISNKITEAISKGAILMVK